MDESKQPARVRKDAPTSAFAQLAEILRAQIAQGDLAGGQKLPSERELTEFHDLSRGTVRQALDLLRAEGLITSAQGRGAYVTQPPTRITLPLSDPDGPGPPASLVTAIEQAGQVAHVRPLGIPPEDVQAGTLQTACIIFADGTPIAIWQATLDTPGDAWPATPGTGIRTLFVPNGPPQTAIEVTTPNADQQRLLMIGGAQPVLVATTAYTSGSDGVRHVGKYVAERVRLASG